MVYDTDEQSFFYWEGTRWFRLGIPSDGEWNEFLKSDAAGQASLQPLVDPTTWPEPDPALSGSLAISSSPRSVAVQGSYAYVVDNGSIDLKVIQLSIVVGVGMDLNGEMTTFTEADADPTNDLIPVLVNVCFSRMVQTAFLRVTDLFGRVVFEKEMGEGLNQVQIDLGNGQFTNGIYLVSLLENGGVQTKQLVVQL